MCKQSTRASPDQSIHPVVRQRLAELRRFPLLSTRNSRGNRVLSLETPRNEGESVLVTDRFDEAKVESLGIFYGFAKVLAIKELFQSGESRGHSSFHIEAHYKIVCMRTQTQTVR